MAGSSTSFHFHKKGQSISTIYCRKYPGLESDSWHTMTVRFSFIQDFGYYLPQVKHPVHSTKSMCCLLLEWSAVLSANSSLSTSWATFSPLPSLTMTESKTKWRIGLKESVRIRKYHLLWFEIGSYSLWNAICKSTFVFLVRAEVCALRPIVGTCLFPHNHFSWWRIKP